MKKTLLLTLVALFAAPGATASAKHHELVVRARVCGQAMGFRAPVTNRAALVTAYVGNTRLLGVQYGNTDYSTVYMVGDSAVVQAKQDAGGVTVKAVRTVPVCARLRVVFDWTV